jgi:hypothetical protein
MNHYKIYKSIIQTAQLENRIKLRKNHLNYVYYENHHIIPRCLGGREEKENKVLLTAREHFVCHKLLTYIYPKNRKLIFALFRLLYNKNGDYIASSRDYESVKQSLKIFPVSEETKEKHKINCAFKLPEVIEKIRKKTTGRIVSDITCKNISRSKKAKNFHHSFETIKKIKNSLIGRKDSEETLNRKRKPHKKMSEETIQKMKKPKSKESRKNMSLAQKKRREIPFSN